MNALPTPERVAELFRVDADGTLVRLVGRGNAKAGEVQQHVNGHGYVTVNIDGKRHQAHRVVLVLVHGCWPALPLDHIDCNRRNNRPANLRLATQSQNQQNRKIGERFKGITRLPNGRFQAQCAGAYLGSFGVAEQAARAYDRAAADKFGAFARLNFSTERR